MEPGIGRLQSEMCLLLYMTGQVHLLTRMTKIALEWRAIVIGSMMTSALIALDTFVKDEVLQAVNKRHNAMLTNCLP